MPLHGVESADHLDHLLHADRARLVPVKEAEGHAQLLLHAAGHAGVHRHDELREVDGAVLIFVVVAEDQVDEGARIVKWEDPGVEVDWRSCKN